MPQVNKPLPEELARLERRLKSLRSMQAQGRLSAAQYQEEVQELRASDGQGRTWWLAGEAGAWHWWDGKAWVRGQPASLLARAPKSRRVNPSGAKPWTRQMSLCAGVGCIVLGVTCLLGVGALFLGGYTEYRALPKIAEDIQVDAVAAARLPLSSDQERVRAERGDPEAFMILFYEETLEDGAIGNVRTETWSYYTQGAEYTFINGELVGEDPIEVEISQLEPVPYTPEVFQAYMDLQQVIAAAGLDSFLVVPLEKELVAGGEVYYADRLTFGLKDDELCYLEALALDVGG